MWGTCESDLKVGVLNRIGTVMYRAAIFSDSGGKKTHSSLTHRSRGMITLLK